MNVSPGIINRQPRTTGISSALKTEKNPAPSLSADPEDRIVLSSPAKKGASIVGNVGRSLSKIPKYLAHVSKFVGATLFSSLGTAINLAAGGLGILGFAGLGISGAMEIHEGAKEGDKIKILSGVGEVTRGAFTGLLSANTLLDLGKYAGMAASAATILGGAQAGINLTSGMMKYSQGVSKKDRTRRIEGMLEMGMGGAAIAMISGPLTVPGVVAYTALSTARFCVVNKDKLVRGFKAVKNRTKKLWKWFRGSDEEPKQTSTPSNPAPKMKIDPAAKARLEKLKQSYHPPMYI